MSPSQHQMVISILGVLLEHPELKPAYLLPPYPHTRNTTPAFLKSMIVSVRIRTSSFYTFAFHAPSIPFRVFTLLNISSYPFLAIAPLSILFSFHVPCTEHPLFFILAPLSIIFLCPLTLIFTPHHLHTTRSLAMYDNTPSHGSRTPPSTLPQVCRHHLPVDVAGFRNLDNSEHIWDECYYAYIAKRFATDRLRLVQNLCR